MTDTGAILLVGTPLGNDDDVSPRVRATLEGADLIAAEDTRRFLQLAGRLGLTLSAPVRPMHEHNEREKVDDFLAAAQGGARVAVVTDAGMPTISDPGFVLARAAYEAGVPVDVIPGPSAVVTALALAGIPTDSFAFDGFPPRKSGQKHSFFAERARDTRTLVLYESPRRLADTLQVIAEELGPDREIAVCRELTKTYQEVLRGTAGDLAALDREFLGEITLVIAGARTGDTTDDVDPSALADAMELVDLGLRTKDAAGYVAARTGVSKSALYQAIAAARR